MPSQAAIDYFCGHCDYKDRRKVCSEGRQSRYVRRDFCGWSDIQGVRVYPATRDTINVGGVEYKRCAVDQILEAVAREKQKEARE